MAQAFILEEYMGKMKSHAIYVAQIAKIHGERISVEGIYAGDKVKILHKCNSCNQIKPMCPSDLIQGKGCRLCSMKRVGGQNKKTHDDYLNEVQELHSSKIFVPQNYENDATKIEHVCTVCDYAWSATPTNILQNHGCPACARQRTIESWKRTNAEYLIELAKMVDDDFVPLEEYIDARTPIKHLCKFCQGTWKISPDNALRGKGCPICKESHGEKAIRRFLDDNQIVYVSQKTFVGCKRESLLRFDFYLPERQICIEYDGEQHFRPCEIYGGQEDFEIRLECEAIKDAYCIANEILLLRIPYYRLPQIDSILASILLD